MAKQARGTIDGNTGVENNPSGNVGPVVGAGSSTGGGPELIIIDPASIGGPAGNGNGDGANSGDNSGEPRKRRGRKPGSTNSKKTGSTLDINGVEALLFSAHTILASISATPELILDKAEAHEIAEAVANVSRHYDVAVAEKTMDWSRLLMALGMVYGTRLYAIRARRIKDRGATNTASVSRPAAQSGNANTVEIPGVGRVDMGGFTQ